MPLDCRIGGQAPGSHDSGEFEECFEIARASDIHRHLPFFRGRCGVRSTPNPYFRDFNPCLVAHQTAQPKSM